MRRKTPVSFTVDIEQLERLDAISQRTKIPKSVLVRQGIDQILQAYEGQMPLFGPPVAGPQAGARNQPRP